MSIDLIKRLRLGTGTSTSPDHELLLEAAKAIEEYRMKYILAAEGKDRAQRRLSELEAQLEELQKQEPVAWMARSGSGTTVLPDERMNKDYYNIPLYTAPIPTPSQQEAIRLFERALTLGCQSADGHDAEMTEFVKAKDSVIAFILARPDAPSYVWQVAGKTFQMLFATEEDANKWQRFAGMGTASTYIQPIKVPVCTFRDDEAMK